MIKISNLVTLSVFIIFFQIQKSTSVQNQAPRFDPPLQSNYFFPEYNATKPGDILLWLNATDIDDDDLQFGVENDFYKKFFNVKKIDGKHAMVLANRKFDREIQEKYENIVFYVKDKPGNKVYQSVRFIVLDIDDNPPVFKNTPYKIDILENHPIDSILFDGIEAFDSDGPLYNKFTFSITNVNNDNNLFYIDKANFITSGVYSTNIILKKNLDYKKFKNHLITITAFGENSIFSTSTELLINVVDFPNRKPEFYQSPYYVRIPEEMDIGDFVIQVSARDGDSGINNPCKYEIVKDSLNWDYFKIESTTGIITINKRIDLESNDIIMKGGLLEFNVIAIEIGDEESTQETKVTVAILDINDNNPIFNKNSFNLAISPKSSDGTSLTLIDNDIDSIHVYDLDKGINGSFSLLLLKSKNKNEFENSTDFEVVPKIALNDANLIIKLKRVENLQKRIGFVEHYHLIAKDNGINGKQVYVDIYIKIENINEHVPQFEKNIYTLFINENSAFNTTVGYLKAFDNDTYGDYGRITYELKNGQDRFQIDNNTGRIYTISNNSNVELDRELIETYFMSVDAIDGGGLRTSAQLIIKLNDLNDNRPLFTNNLFNLKSLSKSNSTNSSNILIGYIEENSSKWIESIKLQALDRDIGLNGVIEYDIIEGECFKDYFQIDSKYNRIILKENMTLDFEEINRLKQKTDLKHKSIQFTKEISNLVLNPDEIDLNLVVIARDLGTPPLSTKIIAKIIVKDVNDNKPKFDRSIYYAKVLETARFGNVIQVNAVDLDAPNTANSKIIYNIESGDKDKFSIDSTSGMVRINENTNLDRDMFRSSYKLKIVAHDFETINSNKTKLNETDTNYCYLMIEIVDVNNKKPQIMNNKTVMINEDVKIGTKLIDLKAIDLDSDSKLSYFIITNNSLQYNDKSFSFDENNKEIDFNLVKNWFAIDPENGTLFIKSQIDREIAEYVHLGIGVEDLNASNGFKPQITTTTLKIKINDINDNYPIFPDLKQTNLDHNGEDPIFVMHESIDENIKINTKIAQLKVKDADKNNNITFKIINSNDPYKILNLNKYTGEIFVQNIVDYEKIKWVNLSILVNDNGSPTQKHSILQFYCQINDLNDNSPKFIQLNQTEFEINENNQEKYLITQFKAIDYDSGSYGTVNYKLLSGDEDKFEVNPLDGKLYAKIPLDREDQSSYKLLIQAKDNPTGSKSKQLTDSILIKIKIKDLNDNKPKCEQNNYFFETVQNVDIGTVLAQIKALDPDSGNFSKLVYSLSQNDLFEINTTTGQIKTKKKLVGYSGSFKYNLTLKDNNGESGYLSNECQIEILIKDYNMHSPKFIYPNVNTSIIRIRASLPFGSYLLTVNATDEDNGPNGEIIYFLDERRIKNNDWKSFNLDSKTGVLTLNTKLNLNQQSVYSIDIIASDKGKQTQLQSRLTLIFILMDDSNNTAKFNRMEICLSGIYQCEKNNQHLIVRMKEELEPVENSLKLNLAKISDVTKKDQDICYYLLGRDADYFSLNKTTGILTPRIRLDRETREKYDLILKASEYCNCDMNEVDDKQCNFVNQTYDLNDLSLLRVKLLIDDVNDNNPKFIKNFYQIGITSDIDFGDVILDSFAYDLDNNSTMDISILNSTYVSNNGEHDLKQIKYKFPFSLQLFDTKSIKSSINNDKLIRETKFQIKTQQYFKENNYLNEINKNIVFQFNITVSDENNLTDSSLIQVILINKEQRVKLVFSQPIEKVVKFQDEFQKYISNLTGFSAYIDKIRVHRIEDYEDENLDYLANQHLLTDMLLHFVEPSSNTIDINNISLNQKSLQYHVVDSDTIISILDKSKDSNLLKKYKLSLAEKIDNQGLSIFYKYGSAASDDEFGSFFLLSPSTNPSNFFTKILFTFILIVLLFCTTSLLIVCFCMRLKYKRKLRAERAMVKAFGLEQRSFNYNDAINGYINHAFDSNSLLPIPGTNLYAYEGSNPIWLKKYDKIDTQNNPSSSSSSSTTTDTNDTAVFYSSGRFNSKDSSFKTNLNKSHDISSFYLKQIDSSAPISRCSPISSSNNSNSTEKNTIKNQNVTLTSDILSVQDLAQPEFNQSSGKVLNDAQNLTSFKSENLLTFAPQTVVNTQINNIQSLIKQGQVISFKEQIKLISSQRLKQNSSSNCNNTPTPAPATTNSNNEKNESAQTIIFPNSSTSYTKIFDNYQQAQQEQDSIPILNQSNNKEFSDLFAVESTVI